MFEDSWRLVEVLSKKIEKRWSLENLRSML